MEKKQNSERKKQTVFKSTEKKLPAILKDQVFNGLRRKYRSIAYTTVNQLIGVRKLSMNTIKRYFLYLNDTQRGIPGNEFRGEIIEIMETAAKKAAQQALDDMLAKYRDLGSQIKTLEKYLK